MPGWALNTAVDELLKKEFDYHRKKKSAHPIMKEYKLNFIPFRIIFIFDKISNLTFFVYLYQIHNH